MSTLPLPDVAPIPVVGFGVYQIPPDETQAAVEAALELGYRHIDTAAAYRNEREVGHAIAVSGLPRDEVFVTTKLWVQNAASAEEDTVRAGHASADRLGLDRIDLYLMHQPFGDTYAQWRGMQRLRTEGLVGAIGVSNWTPGRVADLIANNDVPPAVNQIEINPFFQRTAAVESLQEMGLVVEAWAPFAEGRNDLFHNPILSRIGEAHDASVAQVVLAWLRQRRIVGLAKSVRADRIAENFASTRVVLTDADLADIATLDTGATQFFEHDDPAWVTALGTRRLED